MDRNSLERIAIIGGYLPRQCGIATFTTDLCQAVAEAHPQTTVFAVSVNDTEYGYNYPARVRFELLENDLASYRRAADFLNISNVDVVCLQHEYGIFGGPAGSHILALLRELHAPVITTLHTILRDPAPEYREVMEQLNQLSDRLVVMSQRGKQFLVDLYGVPEQRIDHIPHGIPDVPFVDPNFYKAKFNVEGKQVLLTFGLLSRSKGIENVIRALPTVLARHPNVVYMVLGATHPRVKRVEGESYRLFLERLSGELGIEDNVVFHNRFVSLEELVEFIGVADIYITPYLNREQMTSGTLAYALGAGKAVISTPYWYAEELLSDGRGVLVSFGQPDAIAAGVIELLNNEAERHAMRREAYLLGREMIWPRVAERYMQSFLLARSGKTHRIRRTISRKIGAGRRRELPELKLDHLKRLTDDTGILQHAMFTVPNYDHGYCTDDNARALIAAVLLKEIGPETAREAKELASRYLAFLWHAFNPESGRFHNFLSYDRRWLSEAGSEDSHGRALWSLGMVLGRSADEGLRGPAAQLFSAALLVALEFEHLRPCAFALVGTHEYLRAFYGDRHVQEAREVLAERLMDAYLRHSSPDWPWFTDSLTYCNAKLPHALLLSGRWLFRDDMVASALESLRWLAKVQRSEDGVFMPIGCHGFYPRGEERAYFDQQPIEAQAMVSACLEAYRITDEEFWYREARRAFEWFLGRNQLRIPLYDSITGGCRDGLHPDRANQNQGAESTLAFLLSLLEIRLSEQMIRVPKESHARPQPA